MNSTRRAHASSNPSRGIGLGLVSQYAADGWRVHATTRPPERPGALGGFRGDQEHSILSAREPHHLIGTQAAARNAAHSSKTFLDLRALADRRKTIAGLLAARSGAITFEDQDITAIEAQDLVGRGISLVPEGRQMLGRMSVEENLMLGAYSRPGGAREDDFAHCFALFPRLEERRSQRVGTLSGGEQQMLAIARGLMSRPRLLLMDEPSLGLAPQLVSRTFEVVERLRVAGTTILMVEQMARQAHRVSNRAYVLEHGRIVHEGTSADLFDDPRVLGAYLGSG